MDSEPRRNQKATASLIFGILSWFVPILLSIPAIILGILALRQSRQDRHGAGPAKAGIVLGTLSILAVIAVALLLPGFRDSAGLALSENNLKQIVLGLHSHNDAYRSLPAHASYNDDGEPLLSWRVAILPFVEHDVLFNAMRHNEPWDSPHNKRFLEEKKGSGFFFLEEKRKKGQVSFFL